MGDHKRSKRFKDVGFDCEIIEESIDRDYIGNQEEYWIQKLNTYNNGLNESSSGKGWGHNSSKFTTLGYVFSDESRKKMSESAKKRVTPDLVERLHTFWKDPKFREHQSNIRKGKRLRPLKISDEKIAEIRNHYKNEYNSLVESCVKINEERHKKNPSWLKTNPAVEFAKLYKKHYGCSSTFLRDIVLWKTRQNILPSIHGKI